MKWWQDTHLELFIFQVIFTVLSISKRFMRSSIPEDITLFVVVEDGLLFPRRIMGFINKGGAFNTVRVVTR